MYKRKKGLSGQTKQKLLRNAEGMGKWRDRECLKKDPSQGSEGG